MDISFNIPVKDHFLYNKKAPHGKKFYPNIDVINARTEGYRNGLYENLPNHVVAKHEYIDGMIYYITPRIKSTFVFSFDVDTSILPYVEVHVFQYYDEHLLLGGPVEIHFSGPEELGVLLKLSY